MERKADGKSGGREENEGVKDERGRQRLGERRRKRERESKQ